MNWRRPKPGQETGVIVDTALIDKAARQLRNAAASGTPCGPVREVLGSAGDVEAAYAVQQHNLDLDIAGGRRVSGRKIGLTAEVVQQQLGVDQPDYGTLFTDMCYPDGVDIPAGTLLQPRAEGEIAVVLEHDLDRGDHCVVDVINATAYILPAIEIVDSRIAGWDIKIVDTVADNASCGLYVVGTRPVSLRDINLRDVPMSLAVNGDQVSSGQGSACLGNPLHAAVWVADMMCRLGTPLRAGQCIMTGALGPMVGIAEGDAVKADMGPLGTVSTTLRKAE